MVIIFTKGDKFEHWSFIFYNGQVYEPCLFETIELQRLLIGMVYTPCYK
jgi:hypothetical protein